MQLRRKQTADTKIVANKSASKSKTSPGMWHSLDQDTVLGLAGVHSMTQPFIFCG